MIYDRCRHNCLAFTGNFSKDTHCRRCRTPHYLPTGKAAAQWDYIPVAGRIQTIFLDRVLAELMTYRHKYKQQDGIIKDISNSFLYKELCGKNIIINGVDTGRKFFQGENDVALSMLGDGVQLFERGHKQTDTCWPIILQNLNLPPSERCKLCNVIPGPHQPKDFNSFFYPLVMELQTLASPGVRCYDAYNNKHFTLRAFPLLVCGDMQAIKYFGGLKGPGSKVPCRGCRMVGVYDPIRKSYYLPLTRPFDTDDPPEHILSYDPRNLPLRTTEGIRQQTQKILPAPTVTARNDLSRDFGISHQTILDTIPSLRQPDSYPHEFKHLFLLSHGPNMVALWTGKFDGISGPGSENYIISAADWAEIGRESFAASQSIPSAFIRPLPNIATSIKLYNAESWSFWLQFIGPVVLHGRLPDKYYNLYLDFVWIPKTLLAFSITLETLDELRNRIISYVQRFEE